MRRSLAVIAGLSCRTAVCLIHTWIGFAIVAGWFVLFLWGLVTWLTRRDPAAWFWRLLAALQVTLGIQLIAGIILLLGGHKLPSFLHFGYGVLFPVIALIVAHTMARSMADDFDPYKVFTLTAFVVFGLTLRALTTGLGLP